MASSKLIGTAPDQVPSNADLGELAFQNKDSVEFTGGKGGLSSLDLTAIAASKNVSATDVFVYDTSKDSDGGAWRNRCQNTSWYNETLNTDTRGSRREFPSVAVIVATSSTMTIYDGDSPDLPMWMAFNRGLDTNPTNWWDGNNANTATSVASLNGLVCLGTTAAGVTGADFIGDRTLNIYTSSATSGYRVNGTLANRNSANISRSIYAAIYNGAINQYVNDVAMTVLPNAPIDAATGLPIPTIAVATNGGVSVIHNTGAIYNITDSTAVWNYFKTVNFTQDYKLIINGSYQLSDNNIIHVCDIPYASYNLNTVNAQITQLNSRYYHADTSIPNIRNGSRSLAFTASTGINSFAVGTGALNLIAERPETQSGITSASMVDYITTTFNTGWMPGNIKGAWLSDTTQETLTAPNLVFNGDFASNVSGWGGYSADCVISWSAGTGMVTFGSAGYPGFVQPVSGLTVGKQYVLTADVKAGTYTGPITAAISGIAWGTSATNPTSFTTVSMSFVAQSTTQSVVVAVSNPTVTSGQTFYVDNVSLRLAEPDRSVNTKGLIPYGSITKTPVATGADLVAYSGFSTSNYLERPYNNSFDFGTGEFSFALWVRSSNFAATSQFIAGIDQSGGSLPKLMVYTFGDGRISLHTNGFETTVHAVTSVTPSPNVWHQIVCGRKSGVFYMYLDGTLSGSAASTVTISFASAAVPLAVGYRTTEPGVYPFNGDISLLRISSTFPSDDQIKKMYNDEKVLFQDNAKATLYGTSDAVTALAYDEDTKLLHVGTSSGRSTFQGLRRVDNTTTAVATSISAANGLIAEN